MSDKFEYTRIGKIYFLGCVETIYLIKDKKKELISLFDLNEITSSLEQLAKTKNEHIKIMIRGINDFEIKTLQEYDQNLNHVHMDYDYCKQLTSTFAFKDFYQVQIHIQKMNN
jgi:hypothetical protein